MPNRIRIARLSDAAAIAELHVRTWQTTYRGLLPDALLDELDVVARTKRWQRILGEGGGRSEGAPAGTGSETAAPTSTTVVAVEDERVLGFASAGAARDDDAPCARELWALYVDPVEHGAGVGAELLRTAVGTDPAYLWVLEGNNRAIAFYEKHGFRLDGGVESEERGGRMLRDLRMARP